MEIPAAFLNEQNEKLFGIVHIPDEDFTNKKRIGINLLNPGIKYRVAPNRLNVKLARRLCEKGFYVFRFDPSGIGDSEGELPDGALLPDIWEKIQTGLFVTDTIASNNYLAKNYAIDNIILVGNCGGAITSLLAAKEDSRVDRIVLIDVPINLRIAKQSFADKIAYGGEMAEWLFFEYCKKLLKPDSWYRFLTLQSDYRALLKIIGMKAKKILAKSTERNVLDENIEELCDKHSLNRLFFDAVEKYAGNSKRILFILAGNDKGTEIFRRFFVPISDKSSYKENIETYTVEGANHIYTSSEWQEELILRVVKWVSEKD